MFTLLIFIAVLALLVLSHEFGHFIVARKNGIKVHEFGFGFPPRILGIRLLKIGNKRKWQIVAGRHEPEAAEEHMPGTLYSINWLPLGGFVKIKGEDGSDVGDPDSFAFKKVWQKSLVIVAGVVMNVVVAAILLSIGFVLGVPQPFDDEQRTSAKDIRIEIMEVLPGKPAEVAGVLRGDIIKKIDEQEVQSLKQLQNYVDDNKEKELTVTLRRGEEEIVKKIRPTIYEDTGRGGLGVALDQMGTVRYPWYKAIYYGILATGFYLKEIIFAFYYLIKGLFTGVGMGDAVSGPVGVAVMTGQVARMGITYLIQFTALLSLNLAVLNVLPIPALDGGRLLFILLGKLLRRPISQRFEQMVHTVGFVLLMILVVFITVRDVSMFRETLLDFFKKLI